MKARWIVVKGYENYEVCLDRPAVRNRKTGRELKTFKGQGCGSTAALFSGGVRRHYTVARLQYAALHGISVIDMPGDLFVVEGKDGLELRFSHDHCKKIRQMKTYGMEEQEQYIRETAEFLYAQLDALHTGDFAPLGRLLLRYKNRAISASRKAIGLKKYDSRLGGLAIDGMTGLVNGLKAGELYLKHPCPAICVNMVRCWRKERQETLRAIHGLFEKGKY